MRSHEDETVHALSEDVSNCAIHRVVITGVGVRRGDPLAQRPGGDGQFSDRLAGSEERDIGGDHSRGCGWSRFPVNARRCWADSRVGRWRRAPSPESLRAVAESRSRTRETVWVETPASRATSRTLARCPPRAPLPEVSCMVPSLGVARRRRRSGTALSRDVIAHGRGAVMDTRSIVPVKRSKRPLPECYR